MEVGSLSDSLLIWEVAESATILRNQGVGILSVFDIFCDHPYADGH